MDDQTIITSTRHWIEKAVIGLNLCPFARSVWAKKQVRIVVSHAKHVDGLLEDLDRELDLLASTPPEEIDTTLLIHPTLFPDFEVFNDFLEVVDEVVDEHELEGVIQVASFHPDYRFEGAEEGDVSNATNRSPYPTLHLLREDSISRAVESEGGDAEAIVERNIATLEKLGWDGWRALLKQ
ncbi:DUF1415 domain-containing protein [Hydrogenophaga sp. 5NK40-0174]|uniref:DUF1415 domain-containing protein n=1 Tax=Hydrogenophaga sp. 5NK40-0174 TaxID=3127649 RepID=UPI0031065167